MLELRFLFFFVLLPLKFRRAAKIAGKEAAKPEEWFFAFIDESRHNTTKDPK